MPGEKKTKQARTTTLQWFATWGMQTLGGWKVKKLLHELYPPLTQ